MPYSHLIALTGYVEGREQDYNDWYTWVHLRDVMRLSLSVVAAQRFRASRVFAANGSPEYDFPYLCIYEVIDPEAMTRDHAPVFTDEMPVSDAYDLSRASEVYFDEVASFTRRPGSQGIGDVIIERFGDAPCDPAIISSYLRERFPRICALPGIVGASVEIPNDHQMFEQPISGLCAVYRTTNLAATAQAWPSLADNPSLDLQTAPASINAYEATIDRLTIFDVRSPSEQDRKTAARIRSRLNDRLHSGPSAHVRSDHFA